MYLEWEWNAPGVGMYLEWEWNVPGVGMECAWSGNGIVYQQIIFLLF